MGNIYVGKNNVARRVKNVYVGVNGVARKVKNTYLGVNSVARKVYSAGNLIEFVRVKSDGTYDYVTTHDNGSSITTLHTLNFVKEQNCHIWNRNNVLYRMLVVVTPNHTAINYLQKKEFGATSWSTISASSEGDYTYSLTYNQQEDTFMITQVYGGVVAEENERNGRIHIYCTDKPIAGSSIETVDITKLSYTSTTSYDDLDKVTHFTCRPVVYKNHFYKLGYHRYLRDSDLMRGVRFYYILEETSTTYAWKVEMNGGGVADSIFFKDGLFCSPEVFDFDLVTTPSKLTFYASSSPTVKGIASLGGSPYSFHTDFMYGNAKGRFFLRGSELVYVVPVKYDTGGDVAVINIYTSTDGNNFTLVSSTPLPSVGSSARVSTYFGETKDKWNFAVSSDFNGSTTTKVVFYSIDKNTLALEYNSPTTMEGRIYCQGHTKYE